MKEIERSILPVFTEEEIQNEIWKLTSRRDKAEVSNLGRVRTLGVIKDDFNIDSDGYVGYSATIHNNKLYNLHRVVGKLFIPNPDNKETINHKDGNKQNNRVTNLEWSTRKENTTHAVNSGLWTNNIPCVLEDIKTGEIINYQALSHISRVVNIDVTILLKYIKYSHKYPIKGRYKITIDEDKLLDVISSGKEATDIWVYDYILKSWVYYKSMSTAVYFTSLNIGTIRNHIDKDVYLGYLITTKKDNSLISKFIVDTDVIKKERLYNISKPYLGNHTTLLLYDYSKQEEIVFNSIDKVLEFLINVEPSYNIIVKDDIIKSLGRCVSRKRTWLLKGYGITSSKYNIDWTEYSEQYLINSKYGHSWRNWVFEIKLNNQFKDYVFGAEALADYLNILQNNKNKRASASNLIKRYGVEKLVELSGIPNISIRQL